MIKLKSALLKRPYIKLVEKGNVENAHAIHVASDYEKNKFELLGLNAKAIVIPRVLSMDEYDNNKPLKDMDDIYPELKGKRKILFLGRIHPKKGFDILGPAMKKILEYDKNVALIIAGPDEAGYANTVKKMFSSLGILEHALFTGMVLGQEKIALLKNSEMFVLPSHGENFGIAVLEALACEIPVIVTDKTGLSSDILNYNCGVVTKISSEDFARGIMMILRNGTLRQEMGINGKKLVREKYSWDVVGGAVLRLYDDIMAMAAR